MDRMAICTGYGQARDGGRLASKGIPTLLEVEEPPSQWPPVDNPGSPRSHSKNESGKSSLGGSPYSWGNTETWNRHLASDCRQVHGAHSKTTLADVAHLS